MAFFADVQYCIIYAEIVGGSEKVQQCADVIKGWSLGDRPRNQLPYHQITCKVDFLRDFFLPLSPAKEKEV
jgi:hypothetical protein